MEGPLISLDVSKGKSNYRFFENGTDRKGKKGVIRHDIQGFDSIRDEAEKMEKRLRIKPSVIFESTGVYSDVVEKYFTDKGFDVYVISPLLSASMRKEGVRPAKNDSLDTLSIAKVFYSRDDLRKCSENDKNAERLREMSYELDMMNRRIRPMKCQFLRLLDKVWPCLDEVSDYSSRFMLDFIIAFGHPENIKTVKGVLSVIRKSEMGTAGRKDKIAQDLFDYCRTHLSAVSKDSSYVELLKRMAIELKAMAKKKSELIDRMAEEARNKDEFVRLLTIPAVAKTTALKIMARVGDISRFRNAEALVAYCGLDPRVYQSGKMTGEHRTITKKGDCILRSTLFLAVKLMVMLYPDTKVARFVAAKAKNGLSYKQAVVAGSAKLARIIYSMLTHHENYVEFNADIVA